MRLTRNFVRVFLMLLLVTTITDIALVVTGYQKSEIWGGTYVGYWAAFGFVWYMVIVFLSKLLGRLWLERHEDYYAQVEDNGELEDE